MGVNTEKTNKQWKYCNGGRGTEGESLNDSEHPALRSVQEPKTLPDDPQTIEGEKTRLIRHPFTLGRAWRTTINPGGAAGTHTHART